MTSSPSFTTAPSLFLGRAGLGGRFAARPQGALGMGDTINWGIFKRHFWGELLRHQHRLAWGHKQGACVGARCRILAHAELSRLAIYQRKGVASANRGSAKSRLSDLRDCSEFVDLRRLSVGKVSMGYSAEHAAGPHVGCRAE